MKKQRGQKRYYKRLTFVNDFKSRITWLNFNSQNIWFEYWCVHFDNHGYGNKSFKKRKPHLDKLMRHYALAANEMIKYNKEFQLWVFINDVSSYDDGLYFHTPNPNKANFPHKYSSMNRDCNLTNKELIDYLSSFPDFIKIYGEYYTDKNRLEKFCILYKDNIGLTLI